MSCVRSLLLLALCCSAARAQSVVTVQGEKGWYTPAGSSRGIPVSRVIYLGGGNGPVDPTDPPIDPPVDPPTDPTELQQLSSMWATKVSPYPKRDSHRQGQMASFFVLADRVDAGSFSDLDEVGGAEQFLRELVLGEDKEKWSEWYAPIGVYLVANVSSIDEVSPAYRSIAAGLAVPGEAIGDGWIGLIEAIIDALGEGTIPPFMMALIRILLGVLGG